MKELIQKGKLLKVSEKLDINSIKTSMQFTEQVLEQLLLMVMNFSMVIKQKSFIGILLLIMSLLMKLIIVIQEEYILISY